VPFPGGCLSESQAFYQPELSYNYELGLKTELLDRTLRLNTAIFFTEYEDYQSTFSIPGLAQVLISNAAKVESFGMEADFVWAASDMLTLNGSVTYVDTEYDSFEGSTCGWSAQPGCVAGQIDLSGKTLNRAPELSFNVGAELRSAFSAISGAEWFARLDAVYSGDQNLSSTLEDFAEEDAYTLVNARAGLELDNGLKVTLWGRNVFDEEYRINAGIRGSNIRQGTVQQELPGLEATYGVTVDYEF
jgi:iron complex outermembrane receptor protein